MRLRHDLQVRFGGCRLVGDHVVHRHGAVGDECCAARARAPSAFPLGLRQVAGRPQEVGERQMRRRPTSDRSRSPCGTRPRRRPCRRVTMLHRAELGICGRRDSGSSSTAFSKAATAPSMSLRPASALASRICASTSFGVALQHALGQRLRVLNCPASSMNVPALTCASLSSGIRSAARAYSLQRVGPSPVDA